MVRPAVQWFVQFSGLCSSVVYTVQRFVQISGSCSSMVHACSSVVGAVQLFVQFSGSCMQFSGSGSYCLVVRAVQWFVPFMQ